MEGGVKTRRASSLMRIWARKAIKTLFQGFRLARSTKGKHKKRRK